MKRFFQSLLFESVPLTRSRKENNETLYSNFEWLQFGQLKLMIAFRMKNHLIDLYFTSIPEWCHWERMDLIKSVAPFHCIIICGWKWTVMSETKQENDCVVFIQSGDHSQWKMSPNKHWNFVNWYQNRNNIDLKGIQAMGNVLFFCPTHNEK